MDTPLNILQNQVSFKELPSKWKALSIMGIIFTILCTGLLVLVILMFKTDLILWPVLEIPKEELEDEFGDFLKEFEFGSGPGSDTELINRSYKHPIKDLEGHDLLDLMQIEIYE